MRIQYVKIKNLGPFKKLHLRMHDKDVIGVQAKWKGNSRKSNQSGKTFLLETMKWGLTGESRAEKDVELIHHGEEYGEVIIGIGDDTQTHIIRRGKDHKNNSVLEMGSQDKSKEAQEAINKLIGFLPSEFDMTVYFEQEEINSFMKLNPTKKKEYIMKWLENNYWNDPYSRANRDYQAAQKSLDELKSNQAFLEDKYESMSHDLGAAIAEKEAQLVTAREELVVLESKLKKAEKSLKNDSVDDLYEKIEEAKKSKAIHQKALDSFHAMVEEIKSLEEKSSKIKIVKPKVEEKELYERMANARQTIKDLKGRLSSAEQMTGRCPLLGEDCDRVKVSLKKVKEWKDQKSKLSEDLENDSDVILEIQAYKESKEKFNRLSDKIETLTKQADNFEEKGVKKSIKEWATVITETEQKIDALVKDESDVLIAGFKANIKNHKQAIEDLVAEVARLNNLIEQRTKLRKEIKALQERIKIHAHEVDDLKYVAFTFGKNGIPSQEIENAFTEVQDEINFVLLQFGTDMEMIFSADRELGDWEKSCVSCGYLFPKGYKKSECTECGTTRAKKRKDELQLKVMKAGQEYGFYMESGGGKTILSLAIRIALVRLKLRKTGSQFKVLFMDEVDAPFDEHNRDSFISLVNNVLIKKLNFSQIFWVSHSKIISDAIPHTLMVTRKGSYSEAEFV